jgi:hypothetical protein
MYRIRYLLLLLPLLAACAPRHAAPNLATAPIPALSYVAVLDGGAVTPIQGAIVVKYSPYPTASFENVERGEGTGNGKTVSFSARMPGTTLAEAEEIGGLLSVTFTIQNVTATGDLSDEVQENLSIKGAKVTLLVSEPYGPIKNVNVFLSPPFTDPARPEAKAKELAKAFLADILPHEGFHQGDTIPYHETYPSTHRGRGSSSFDGKAVVIGKGFYRGRPVIVLDVSGVATVDDQGLGFHGYLFLDSATGIWSHLDGLLEGNIKIEGKAVQLSYHIIDDVRF